jgi:uncharacterized protein YfkK (UPF0435 family)
MATKLRSYVIPIKSPVDQIGDKVRKQRFVQNVLKNKDDLTPRKITQIAKDVGWGTRPQDALKDVEVQQILKPITDQLIQIRQNVVAALQNKNFENEKTTDLTDIMDKLTKNIQLLTGGETEKHKVVFGWATNEEESDNNDILNLSNVQTDNNSILSPQMGNESAQFTTALEGVCSPQTSG